MVVDLSDEPVVNYSIRFNIATIALLNGCMYSKRIGKTAVSAYTARLINKDSDFVPCVVAMGRGGPQIPEIVRGDKIHLTPKYLMEKSDKGFHAASDHWEDALMSRVLTVGCRRCAGGMAGMVYETNMVEGAMMTNDLDVNLVALEGRSKCSGGGLRMALPYQSAQQYHRHSSRGSAIPPVKGLLINK